jgi:E3 ubiquitin-protein ligase listerin
VLTNGCRFGPSAAFAFGTPATPETVPSTPVDPEIAQCLKHLTKRDENTKIKALNALHARVQTLNSEDAAQFLPSWLFTFKKVAMDNSRAVRAGAAKVLGQVVQRAGRKTAPHLKELLGPWWFAMHDLYKEARLHVSTVFQVLLYSKFSPVAARI